MPSITISNTEYYYELHGNGKPLVLIAGYGCDHTFWQLIYPDLSEHFQVLTFDNRGIGQTCDDDGELSSSIMADDTMALINALDLKNPHVVGQSMGGTIAQMLAIRYGDCIDQLALLNTVTRWRKPMILLFEIWLQLLEENRVDMLEKLAMIVSFGDAFLADQQKVDQFINLIQSNPYPQSLRNARRQFKVLRNHDSRSQIGSIKNETLVVLSEEDLIALAYDARQLTKAIPDAHMITLPGGHNSAADRPELVSDALLAFLKT